MINFIRKKILRMHDNIFWRQGICPPGRCPRCAEKYGIIRKPMIIESDPTPLRILGKYFQNEDRERDGYIIGMISFCIPCGQRLYAGSKFSTNLKKWEDTEDIMDNFLASEAIKGISEN